VPDPAAAYPPWFVLACATVAAVTGLWLLVKLLKWALWLLLVGILVGGAVLVGWALLK